jgi:quercetin dioxygenase-like cupin family protein
MNLNADFTQRVVVHTSTIPWINSPIKGVRRRMLDRIGDEVARATSVVQYDQGSSFSPHIHQGGEEFLVIEGIFQDEHGDYPPGSYIRNPPQSKHTPGSKPGCTIFVKLWQFDLNDRTSVRTNINEITPITDSTRPGIEVLPLFNDDHENVRVEHWQPGTEARINANHGAELFVLEGGFTEGSDDLVSGSWLRTPCDSQITAVAGNKGASVWIKDGHLHNIRPPNI